MEAILYDGVTAMRHAAEALRDGDLLNICWAGGQEHVAIASLVRQGSDPATLRLGRTDRPGWRLLLPAAVGEAELGDDLPREARYGRWVDRLGLWRAAAAFALVAAVILVIGHVAPDYIAPHVPLRWERDLGQTLVGDFGDNRCAAPAGNAALRTLTDRIAPGSAAPGDGQLVVTPLDLGIFNAAALPGGQIVIFRGMLLDARDPDAIAGVLAHEVAHVRRRHVTQALIRELGIGSFIRLFAGGIGANTEQLVALSYTRASEAQADADAIATLSAAHIDPRPTARLFDQLAGKSGEAADAASGYGQFLASHPVSRERARRFAASFDPRAVYRPVLDSAQAAALLDVCWDGKGQRPSLTAPRRPT